MTSDVAELRRQLADANDEIEALREIVKGGDFSQWGAARLTRKVARQRAALDTLNRRVVSQRFELRTLNELGRGLSREEYARAREATADPQLKARIAETAAA